ncbi:MAG TPA: hypothetical protein VF721_05575 [Pyrinomonadaceae bacterium]|jgi:hypothetical protein
MRAITIAIGKTGIDFFAQKLVVKKLVNTLSALKPPDKTINIGGFVYDDWSLEFKAESIIVYLTQGKLLNFSPKFQSFAQQDSGNFSLTIAANNFTAQYNWEEKYNYFTQNSGPRGGHPTWSTPEPKDKTFGFTPAFPVLTLTVPLRFEYNNGWEIVVLAPTANTPNIKANVPSDSILQYQEGIYRHNVSDASASSVSAIDFSQPVRQLIGGIVADIPASGNLGNGIVYDFSLGDNGLKFTGSDGIQMGVKGGASYNGTAFSGDATPTLPLPVPPADTDSHHLNMYVSNYEIDALYWTYWKAGKLNVVVNAADLQDPNILKVKTYTSSEKSLKPFQSFAMQAQISPFAAPASAFQTVWVLTTAVMDRLTSKLPSTIWNLLNGLQGNAYASQSSLETDLTGATIPSSDFQTIEKEAQSMGMVVTSSLNFDLIIQTFQPNPPDIKFSVTRTDILSNLRLGVGANKTQTLQYDFTNITFSTTFNSSTVPGFSGGEYFSNTVWQQAGEPQYEKALAEMGGTGVPLPIMADFKFDFENAELSIQQGYVSILASVLYKNK